MRLGIVSDIHCDIVALERALQEMPPVDYVLCAGDMVLQYRFSNDLLDLIRERKIITVLGNHDAAVISSAGLMLRNSGAVSRHHIEYLQELPTSLEMEIDGKLLMMMHTSPMDPTGGGEGVAGLLRSVQRHKAIRFSQDGASHHEIPARLTEEHLSQHAAPPSVPLRYRHMPEARADVLIVGHTHLPVVCRIGETLVVNPGSVSLPRDVKQPLRRTFAVLDTEICEAHIHSWQE